MSATLTFGSERVAQRHDANGQHRLARIERLTAEQARFVLCYLAGFSPDDLDTALGAEEGMR